MMQYLREFVLMIIAGIILYLAFTIGLWVSVLAVSLIPFGALGWLGDLLAAALLVAILGGVGRYILRYMP